MKWRQYALPASIFIILLVFVLYPMLTVLLKSAQVDGQFSLDNYRDVFTQPHLSRTVWGSLLVSSGSAIISSILGLILALTVFKTTLPLRRLFTVVAVLPMITPGFVTSLSYMFLFGRNGLITYKLLHITWEIYSWRSVLILQSLGFTTTAFLLISAVLGGSRQSHRRRRAQPGGQRMAGIDYRDPAAHPPRHHQRGAIDLPARPWPTSERRPSWGAGSTPWHPLPTPS